MELILGIDPGSYVTGWAVLQQEGRRLQKVDSGTIRLPKSAELCHRLALLHTRLGKILDDFKPLAMAVEDIFIHRNVQSALALGQARGVILAAAGLHGLSVHAYPPATVKRAVCGHGQAQKPQIQRMVQVLLSLPAIAAEDESDAIAVAICHALCRRDIRAS